MMMDGQFPWDALAEPTTRQPRAIDTRTTTQRKTSWTEPTMLPDPTPRDGWSFKWVRTATREKDDKANFQKRSREGWEPVNAEDFPEMMIELNTGVTHGKVEVGGLILCQMPLEMVQQRNAHYQKVTAQELEAAEDSYMRDDDERMKKVIEKRRQAVFGR